MLDSHVRTLWQTFQSYVSYGVHIIQSKTTSWAKSNCCVNCTVDGKCYKVHFKHWWCKSTNWIFPDFGFLSMICDVCSSSGSSLHPCPEPGDLPRVHHPLVLWQTGKRLCTVLVWRMRRQREPLWHRGWMQEDMRSYQYRYITPKLLHNQT